MTREAMPAIDAPLDAVTFKIGQQMLQRPADPRLLTEVTETDAIEAQLPRSLPVFAGQAVSCIVPGPRSVGLVFVSIDETLPDAETFSARTCREGIACTGGWPPVPGQFRCASRSCASIARNSVFSTLP